MMSRFRESLVCACLLAGLACSGVPASSAQQPASQTPLNALIAKIEAGATDPAADAIAAAGRGEFGLIVTGDGRFIQEEQGGRPGGIFCLTPYGGAPLTLMVYAHGDYIQARDWKISEYVVAYNSTLVDLPTYPHAELCRVWATGDPLPRWEIDAPVRPVSGPVRSLHEAARRGGAGDVDRFLRSTPVDTFDGMGMTALAWAVARGNRPAIEALQAAGADPWAEKTYWGQNAVFWAAAMGRQAEFERFVAMPGRKWREWPAVYLNAALHGESRAIMDRMLAEPHAQFRIEMQPKPLPAPQLVEVMLESAARHYTDLLREGVREDRPDLVGLAVSHKADTNLVIGSDTPLGHAASGIRPMSENMVFTLLGSGADPNLISNRERPLWKAVNTLRLDGEETEVDKRAKRIFGRLIGAGADINLANDEGRPPVWFLLFPYRHQPRVLDASFVTPSLLDMLVRNGMDLNAVWEGQRVLLLVERQAGADSELAGTLRRLGARP
jgi:hypothetical protein